MKPVIDAVVGVLADSQGRVLVAQRPADKICPGKWEFPGGKIESGETALIALRRELMEELGVDVIDSDRLVALVNEFPDRCVHLDVWLVRRWRGVAFGVENQAIQWLLPTQVAQLDFLPGSEVILTSLADALVEN